LEKIPAIYERLGAGDPEAVSHALDTCRRIINSFADECYPPQQTPLVVGGSTIQLGPQNCLNRIETYISTRCPSSSRRTRLRKTLQEVYDRVCAGIHADVALDEAKALFLHTYLVLGEIALLPDAVKTDPD
jgi:hypothetical protein